MQINLVYNSSVNQAPGDFKLDMAAAANYLDATLTNNITVTIEVGYGEIDGQPLGSGTLGEGGADDGADFSYAEVKSALIAHATTASDVEAIDSLPASDPTGGGEYFLSSAEEKALGLMPASSSEDDGSVGFSSTASFDYSTTDLAMIGQYDFFGVAVHELTHALGRAAGLQYAPNTYTALDLYRFASSGKRELAGGAPAYFSLNDGATNLGNFDTTSDYSDWAQSNGADSFDAYVNSGVVNPVSSVDLEVMGALGFSVGTAPTVNSVSFSSARSPAGIGSTVSISLAFNESMSVSGSPTLMLDNESVATYASGSGSTTITFAYTVAATDANVAALAATAIAFAGGDIVDGSGSRPVPALTQIAQSGPQIDTTPPVLAAFQADPTSSDLGVGASITYVLKFSEPVYVAAGTSLSLSNGAVAGYASGSGSTSVSFTYTVAAGDSPTSSLTIAGLAIPGGIADAAGNTPSVSYASLASSGPQVDPTPPEIAQLTMTPASGLLDPGKTVVVTLTLTKAVTVAGAPFLTLNDGGVATYSSGSGSQVLTFSTTIAPGAQSVAALQVIGLETNGGAIADAAGNPLAMPASGLSQAGPQIDTVAPSVTAIAISPASGTLATGGSATITLTLSKPVVVAGSPALTLNDGGSATYIGGSGGVTLTFLTTVDATDIDVAALAATSIDSVAGGIDDLAGNAVASSLSGLVQNGPSVAVGGAASGGQPPDESALLSPLSAAMLAAALGAVEGPSLSATVVTSPTGATSVAAAAGSAAILVATSVPAGGVVSLPQGYRGAYLTGGNGASLVDNQGGAVLLATSANDTVFAAAGDTAIGGDGAATLVGGVGAETLVGGTGANLFSPGASAADMFSQGADTIIGGAGAETLTASSHPLYFGGAGAFDFQGSGGAATLVGGGAETVNAAGTAVLLFGGAGAALDFVAGSAASTVVGGGGGQATVAGGAAPLLYFGLGATSYVGGSAVDTVVGLSGAMTAAGGAGGALIFTSASGNSRVETGAGSSTVLAFGAADSVHASGGGTDVVMVAGASATIDGAQSTGANTYFAFQGGSVVLGGAGETAIEAVAGNDTLSAGTGATLFVIVAGQGARTETIENFNPARDFIELAGYPLGAGASALAGATVSGGTTAMTLADGTQLTFVGTTNVGASSFVL